MQAMASESSTLNLDELESQLNQQLKDERQQHEATKQLLRNEQEKVRRLQKEEDGVNHFNNGLAVGIRLNGYGTRAAMTRIEPTVNEILERVTALHGFHGFRHAGLVVTGVDSQHRGEATHVSALSSSPWPDQALQLSTPNPTDQRHSILYDFLAKESDDDIGKVLDFCSFFPEDTKHEALHLKALHQPDVTGNKEQITPCVQVCETPVQHAKESGAASGASDLETGASGQGEFYSLDKAFENDFFSKPVGGSGTGPRLSSKEMSEVPLLDMGMEEGGLPKSGVVNSGSSETGALQPAKNEQSGEDQKESVGGPVVTSKESHVKHPLGVEIVS